MHMAKWAKADKERNRVGGVASAGPRSIHVSAESYRYKSAGRVGKVEGASRRYLLHQLQSIAHEGRLISRELPRAENQRKMDLINKFQSLSAEFLKTKDLLDRELTKEVPLALH